MSNHPYLNIAVQAARKAGAIIVRALDRMENVKISQKEDSIVTDIDHQAEKEIIEIIRKAYPTHSILAEESGSHQGDDTIWIIDPIDGTNNFCRGFPHFCVSIAVQQKGQLEHAVIYDPIRQELFTASRGQGAKLNQYRLRVSPCLHLSTAIIATSTSIDDSKVQGVRNTGSSALDLAYVAAGRLDALWEIKTKPWDVAAGVLLVTEAGGLVNEPNGGNNFLHSGNIVAANPKLMEELLKVTASPSAA